MNRPASAQRQQTFKFKLHFQTIKSLASLAFIFAVVLIVLMRGALANKEHSGSGFVNVDALLAVVVVVVAAIAAAAAVAAAVMYGFYGGGCHICATFLWIRI